jgi:hypothetical protein
MSNPSVNQLYTGANSLRASSHFPPLPPAARRRGRLDLRMRRGEGRASGVPPGQGPRDDRLGKAWGDPIFPLLVGQPFPHNVIIHGAEFLIDTSTCCLLL